MKGLMQPRTVLCAICEAPFQTRHSQGKYCSPEHAREGQRKSWRKYGDSNRDMRRSYHKKFYRENVSAVSERVNAYRKTEAGKAVQRRHDERQREKFPEKYQARQEVLKAIRSGRIKKKPCGNCGATKAQAHHHDYSKPLDVEWLCPPCHRAEHQAAAAE